MLGSAPKAHYSNIEQGTARSTVRELKFGIIGTGWPGQQHAIALAEIPDVQLHSCADSNLERLRGFAEIYRLESSFEDYQELLHDRDLDAAII